MVDDGYLVSTAARPLDATIRPPGSKSITNRALVCAALAAGSTTLRGALHADDTDAMVGCLRSLGVDVVVDSETGGPDWEVLGCSGRPPTDGAVLDAGLSGTTARFVAPIAALAHGTVLLDGAAPLRRRPMAPLLDALGHLGADVEPMGPPGHLPVRIGAPPGRALGGPVTLSGDVSSQFLSALLLSGPCFEEGLDVEITTPLVSVPYVQLTASVMESFGVAVDHDRDWRHLHVGPGAYRSVVGFEVEPDASAASYWAAAAVIVGGSVRVEGLGRSSLQGDVAFIDVLGRMGAEVTWSDRAVVVRSTGVLHGVEVDMADFSDTAQTLAAVAPFADSPTTVTGIGFIRGKETDRVAAVVSELRGLGVEADEEESGFTVRPGSPVGGSVRTYDDHRMAMSFALIGLRTPGVRILDPGCTAKTYPGFWSDLERITARGVQGGRP